MTISRKILALVMAFVMLFTMLPAGAVASATEATEPPHDHEHTHEAPAETEPAAETETVPSTEPVTESVSETEPAEETEPAAETEPVPETAALPEKQGGVQDSGSEPDRMVRLNPVYEGILTIDDLVFPEEPSDVPELLPQDVTYLSVADAGATLRQQMKNRVGQVTVYVRAGSSSQWDVLESVFTQAVAHTGVPDEGDSLKWQYGGWQATMHGKNYVSGSYNYTFTVQIPYYTTASQERQLTTAVNNLLARLDLEGKTDYEKVCAFYDYICDNIVYDYVHLNNNDYTLQFTAYAALVNGTAVCQGLSVLLYRLCLEAGIGSRVITSIPSECHAWSIVGLDGWYYLCDSTWDLGANHNYSWFLRGSNYFPQHTAAYDDEYRTAEFTSRFPINPNNYSAGTTPGPGDDPDEPEVPSDPSIRMEGKCGDNVHYTLYTNGKLTLTGSGATYDYPEGYSSPWENINEQVTSIEVGEGITKLGQFLFWGCENAASIQLPSTLRTLDVGALEYCRSLTALELPNSLQTISDAALWGCEQLEELIIPASVTYIGDCAFYECYGLEQIRFRGSAPTFYGYDIFGGVTATIYYPASDRSWRNVIGNDYGGDLTWVSYADTASSVTLISAPNLVSYAVGDSLNLDGLEIQATLADGSTFMVGTESVTVVSCDMSTVGANTVVLEVFGFQVTFQIYVHAEATEIVLDPSTYPESQHNYGNNLDDVQTITYPGARSISFTFSNESRTENSWDTIYIYDGNDNLIQEFTGTAFGGSSGTVPGDTMKIRFTSDSSVTDWGYSFDSITANVIAHPGNETGGREATCTEPGVQPSVVCEICGQTAGGGQIPALGHDWDEGVVIRQPEGTTPGLIRYTCRRCGTTTEENSGDIIQSGTFGVNNGLTWALWENGTLSISGSDAMETMAYGRPWDEWISDITDIQIQEGVTNVADNAFSGMENLESICLPSTISSIGMYAFMDSENLSSIRFLGGCPETISQEAFHYLTCEVRYPVAELSWNRETMQSYGAELLTWMPEGEISELVINTLPDNLNYAVGDSMNAAGLLVDARLPNGDVAQLHPSSVMVRYESLSTMGVKPVEVSLQTNAELTASFEVYVHVGREDVTLDPSLYPESEHNYTSELDDIQTISYPGANQITLTFSAETRVEGTHDHIYILDGDGEVWYEYTGAEAAGRTVTVYDDTVQINLVTDYSVTYYGYSFTSITANVVIHTGEHTEGREPTCTEDGITESIACEICGRDTGGQILPALGHDWDEGTAEGQTIVYTCRRCGSTMVDDVTVDLLFEAYEWEVLLLTNRERVANGLIPLTGFDLLQQAAGIRAVEILELFEHTRPNGTSCFTVLDELNILCGIAAENIAYGYATPADVVDAWMNSEGHRANILRNGVAHMGVGLYWVQMFVGRGGEVYTSMQLFFPDGKTFPAGTGVDEMGIYAVLENTVYGTCYLPIMAEFVSGYDPDAAGSQTVTVSVLGFSQSFTVEREEEEPTHVPGDITGDGVVNNKDLTRLFRYLSGYDVEVNEAALDVTGDGAVNNKDVTRLFRYLSGYNVEIF